MEINRDIDPVGTEATPHRLVVVGGGAAGLQLAGKVVADTIARGMS